MELKAPKTSDRRSILGKHRYATAAITDFQGQLRGKTLNANKLTGSGHPVFFAPDNYVLDFADQVLFPRGYLDPDGPIGDNPCVLDWEHVRQLPFEQGDASLFLFAEFAADTRGALWDPRRMYRQIEGRLKRKGLRPVMGLEYEYRLLKENPESLRRKGFAHLELLSTVSQYGSVMHQGVWSEFFTDLRKMCEDMAVPIASAHWEVDAAMAEVALDHRPGIEALDSAILFKTHAKVLASRHDLTLTFMARPLEDADGQSGHVHLSLLDSKGRNAFFDPKGEHGMSATQRYFLGGLQKWLPEWQLLMASNVNSYKRFQPGIFAPTAADWGLENRTTGIRLIAGGAKSQRLEVRIPGSDSNPYLVGACLLGAGLLGIEGKVEPYPEVVGASHVDKKRPKALSLASSLEAAVDRFSRSSAATEVFGEDFVAMYAGTRRSQAEQFSRFVSNRELERFLEFA